MFVYVYIYIYIYIYSPASGGTRTWWSSSTRPWRRPTGQPTRIHIYVCIYIYLPLSLSLSLSPYIYIYTDRERERDYVCICIYIYIYMLCELGGLPGAISVEVTIRSALPSSLVFRGLLLSTLKYKSAMCCEALLSFVGYCFRHWNTSPLCRELSVFRGLLLSTLKHKSAICCEAHLSFVGCCFRRWNTNSLCRELSCLSWVVAFNAETQVRYMLRSSLVFCGLLLSTLT